MDDGTEWRACGDGSRDSLRARNEVRWRRGWSWHNARNDAVIVGDLDFFIAGKQVQNLRPLQGHLLDGGGLHDWRAAHPEGVSATAIHRVPQTQDHGIDRCDTRFQASRRDTWRSDEAA
jgi:hypothetical protein